MIGFFKSWVDFINPSKTTNSNLDIFNSNSMITIENNELVINGDLTIKINGHLHIKTDKHLILESSSETSNDEYKVYSIIIQPDKKQVTKGEIIERFSI